MATIVDDGAWRLAAASTSSFAVNGRFFGQKVTGVQRYAREVVRAMDALLAASKRRGTIVAPLRCDAIPAMQAIDVQHAGPASGHLWEQVVLPARWQDPILNLCNTAPLIRLAQVVCMHDANVFRMPESYGFSFRAWYRIMQPLLARRAACVATVSRDSALQLVGCLPLKIENILVLPNGHEHVRDWNAARATVFDGAEQNRPFVLLLGSRAKHKNAGLILGLADSLDGLGIDLLVAGGNAGIFVEERNVGGPNVRWLGRVSDDDLALLLSRALCLAFPSFTEGFGLPIIEAMALGCPVVSSNRASMPEVCGDAALMASPDDAASWAKHFAALAASAALREDLRARGYLQAARFSWVETARGYLDVLGRLA